MLALLPPPAAAPAGVGVGVMVAASTAKKACNTDTSAKALSRDAKVAASDPEDMAALIWLVNEAYATLAEEYSSDCSAMVKFQNTLKVLS